MDADYIDWMWERTLPELILKDLSEAQHYFDFNREEVAKEKLEDAINKSRQMATMDKFDEDDVDKVVSSLQLLENKLEAGHTSPKNKIEEVRGLLVDFFRREIHADLSNIDLRRNPGFKRYDFSNEDGFKYKGESTGWEYERVTTSRDFLVYLLEMFRYMPPDRLNHLIEWFEEEDISLEFLQKGISQVATSVKTPGVNKTLSRIVENAWFGSGESQRGHAFARLWDGRYNVDVPTEEFVDSYLPIIINATDVQSITYEGEEYDVEEFLSEDFCEYLREEYEFRDKSVGDIRESDCYEDTSHIVEMTIADIDDNMDEYFNWGDLLVRLYNLSAEYMWGSDSSTCSIADYLWDVLQFELPGLYAEFKKEERDVSEVYAFGMKEVQDEDETYECLNVQALRGQNSQKAFHKWTSNIGYPSEDRMKGAKGWAVAEDEGVLYVLSLVVTPDDSYYELDALEQGTGDKLIDKVEVDIHSHTPSALRYRGMDVTEEGDFVYLCFNDDDMMVTLCRIDTETVELEVYPLSSDNTTYDYDLYASYEHQGEIMRVTRLHDDSVGISLIGNETKSLSEDDRLFYIADEESALIQVYWKKRLVKHDDYDLREVKFHELYGKDVCVVSRQESDKGKRTFFMNDTFEDTGMQPTDQQFYVLQEYGEGEVDNWYVKPDEKERKNLSVDADYLIGVSFTDGLGNCKVQLFAYDTSNLIEEVFYVTELEAIKGNQEVKYRAVEHGITVMDDLIYASVCKWDDYNEDRRYYDTLMIVGDDIVGTYGLSDIHGEGINKGNVDEGVRTPTTNKMKSNPKKDERDVEELESEEKGETGAVDFMDSYLQDMRDRASRGEEEYRFNPKWEGYDFKKKGDDLIYEGYFARDRGEVVVDEDIVFTCLMDYFYYMPRDVLIEDLVDEFYESDIEIDDFMSLFSNNLDDILEPMLEYLWFGSHPYGSLFYQGTKVSREEYIRKFLGRILYDEYLDLDDKNISYKALIEDGFLDFLLEKDSFTDLGHVRFPITDAKNSEFYREAKRSFKTYVGDVIDSMKLNFGNDDKDTRKKWRSFLTTMHTASEVILNLQQKYIFSTIKDELQEYAKEFLRDTAEPPGYRGEDALVYILDNSPSGESKDVAVHCLSQEDMSEVWKVSLFDTVPDLDEHSLQFVEEMVVIDDYVIVSYMIKEADELRHEMVFIERFIGKAMDVGAQLKFDYKYAVGQMETISGDEYFMFISFDDGRDRFVVEFLDKSLAKTASNMYSHHRFLPEKIEHIGTYGGEISSNENTVAITPEGYFDKYESDSCVVALIGQYEGDDHDERRVICYDIYKDKIVRMFTTEDNQPAEVFSFEGDEVPGTMSHGGFYAVEYHEEMGAKNLSRADNRVSFFSIPRVAHPTTLVTNPDYRFTYQNRPLTYWRYVYDGDKDGNIYTLESSINARDSQDKKGRPKDYDIKKRNRGGDVEWILGTEHSNLKDRDVETIEYCAETGYLFAGLRVAPMTGTGEVPLLKLDGETGDVLDRLKWGKLDNSIEEVIAVGQRG